MAELKKSVIMRWHTCWATYGGRLVRLLHLLLSVAPLFWGGMIYLHAWRGAVELGHWPVAFGHGPRPGDRHDSPNNMPHTDALYEWTDLPAFLGILGAPLSILAWLLCIPWWWEMPPRHRWVSGVLFALSIIVWFVVLHDPRDPITWMLD